MKISTNALLVLRYLGREYVKAGFPNHKVWPFRRPDDDETFPELMALKLIQLRAASPAGGYRLSDLGQSWIMENRDNLAPTIEGEQ